MIHENIVLENDYFPLKVGDLLSINGNFFLIVGTTNRKVFFFDLEDGSVWPTYLSMDKLRQDWVVYRGNKAFSVVKPTK